MAFQGAGAAAWATRRKAAGRRAGAAAALGVKAVVARWWNALSVKPGAEALQAEGRAAKQAMEA